MPDTTPTTETLPDGCVKVCIGARCGIVSGWHLVVPKINQLRQHQPQENTDEH